MANGLGLEAAYGSASIGPTLQQLLEQRLARRGSQRQDVQQQIEALEAQRLLEQRQAEQLQQESQFGRTFGEDQRQFNEQAPNRLAVRRYNESAAGRNEVDTAAGRLRVRAQEDLLANPATREGATRVMGGLPEVPTPTFEEEQEAAIRLRGTPIISRSFSEHNVGGGGGVGGGGVGNVGAGGGVGAFNKRAQFAPVQEAFARLRGALDLDEDGRIQGVVGRLISPWKGRAVNFARDWGALEYSLRQSGWPDEDIAKALTTTQALAQIQNQLLYIRTGAQINESEFRRLVGEMPGMAMGNMDFMTRLNESQQNINALMFALETGQPFGGRVRTWNENAIYEDPETGERLPLSALDASSDGAPVSGQGTGQLSINPTDEDLAQGFIILD